MVSIQTLLIAEGGCAAQSLHSNIYHTREWQGQAVKEAKCLMSQEGSQHFHCSSYFSSSFYVLPCSTHWVCAQENQACRR